MAHSEGNTKTEVYRVKYDSIYLLTKYEEDTPQAKHIKLGGLAGSPRGNSRTARILFSPVSRSFFDPNKLMKLKEDEQVSANFNSSTEDEDITIDKIVTAFTCQRQQVEVDVVVWLAKPEVKSSKLAAYSSRSPYSSGCYDDSAARGLGRMNFGTILSWWRRC